MSQQGKLGTRLLLGIPTLSTARRSVSWIDALAGLQMPLGSSMARYWVQDRPIAEARNALCQAALDNDVEYLVMLGDDVLPPPNMLLMMLDKIGRSYPVGNGQTARASMITGVYWTKCFPPEPYLWQGLVSGSYRDWTAGEFFPLDLAGCDALMIETAMLRQMPQPWFSTDWVWEPSQPKPSPIATEDFYFFSKARKQGFRLFADTAIQCWHEDRATGVQFGLTPNMPQAGGVPEGRDGELIAELGAGFDLPTYAQGAKVVRFDADPKVGAEVRCDLRRLPESHYGQYDRAHARHVLEHFVREEAPEVVREWARLLKPGGELVIRVPNVEDAMRRILDDQPTTYAWQQLYGAQASPWDLHYNGFTRRKLAALLSTCPLLEDVQVETEDGAMNLKATAKRSAAEDRPEDLLSMWREIEAREGAA